jgi:hypothetical protein
MIIAAACVGFIALPQYVVLTGRVAVKNRQY